MKTHRESVVQVSLVLVVLAVAVLSSGCARNASDETTTAASVSDLDRDGADAAARDAARRAGQGDGRDAMAGRADCQLGVVYFAYDQSELDPAARRQLTDNARCLEAMRAQRVAIIGMTDPRGTTEYNLGLGDRRARTAATFVAAQGVAPETLEVRSFGEELAEGTNEDSWARDRRADFQPE